MATTSSQTPSSSVTYSKNSSSSQTPSTLTPHDLTVWDVFLSFRGTDTRLKFVSHLYNALDYHGIRTYKDTPELRTGEVISDALIQAIHDSRIYIVVFSENYASSSWCLDELIEIYKCHEQKKRLVISVYYEIDPSVVRYQIKSFEQPFQKHEKRYAAEKVNQWRNTLEKVAGFSGQPVSAQSNEADIINEIVEVILLQIKPKTLYVAEYPIGIDYRVKHITALLSRDTEERLIRIGIYGMGGVGKTTLAKALYNQLSTERNFIGSSFLAEVRAASGRANGLVSLQQQLLNDILNSKKPFEVHNVEEGIMFIRERICSRKILVLIDDVDELDQYQSLVGSFAPGSVIIITTRNEEMLDKIKVEPKYKYTAQVLDEAESLALFTAHAFGNAKPDNSLVTLFKDDILHLAGGLPLALKVFGSYLCTQSKAGWKAYINKLKLIPSSTIQQKLLISLDAIELDDPMLKKIFLDIACFFIGMIKPKVVKIMDTYYSDVDHNIDILGKRSLLTIEFGYKLRMHDLLRDMGRDVVRNRSSDDPAKHSRLWMSKDICDVLKKQKGTETIEGIIPINFQYQEALKEVSFATKTFQRMSKLRFLYLCNVNLSGSFEDRFEELTWLRWDCCPLKCLPPEFWPQNLVVLKLRDSKIIMWELNQTFDKLKTLDMSNSIYLTTTPDFAKLPGLKTLRLKGCKSLKKVEISNWKFNKACFIRFKGMS